MTVTAPPDSLSDAARRFLEGPQAAADRRRAACRPRDGRTFESIDPATGEAIAEVAQAGAEDVDAAVQAARGRVRGREPVAQAAGRRARGSC